MWVFSGVCVCGLFVLEKQTAFAVFQAAQFGMCSLLYVVTVFSHNLIYEFVILLLLAVDVVVVRLATVWCCCCC